MYFWQYLNTLFWLEVSVIIIITNITAENT